jgi:enoyl-[acyl-carrier protein] reductase II
MIQTPLTELLKIKVPILLGGMAYIGLPKLAAAVTEAGGLGVLGASTMTPEEVSRSVAELRALTRGPFGVNLSLVVPGFEAQAEAAIAAGVPVVVTSGGSPGRLTARLKQAGRIVLHVVPSARLARKAQEAGVDAVIAEGVEAGGHIGQEEIPLSALVPLVRQAVDLPVVAAGGIACGRGMLAALALGADGVQIGTLFATAAESPAHPRYKQLVFSAGEGDPVVYGRLELPARALRTPAVEKLMRLDRSGASPEEINAARGLGRARRGLLEGNEQEGIFPAGLSAVRIRESRSVAEIVATLLTEYHRGLEGLPHA